MNVGRLRFCVHDCVFMQKVHVFVNWTASQFDKYHVARARRLGYQITNADSRLDYDKDFAGFCCSWDDPGEPRQWIVLVREFRWTIDDQSTLLHELSHALIRIWDFNNVPVNAHTQEFFATSLGELYGDTLRQIVRKQGVVKA